MKLIKEKQPESVEDVKKLTEEYPDMYWGRVIPRIKECEYRIRASNFYNREPIKYYTTTYEDETYTLQMHKTVQIFYPYIIL